MKSRQTLQRACWCGSTTARIAFQFRHEGTPLRYVRCSGCNVLAQWPQIDDARLAKAYAPEYYGKSRTKFVGPIAKAVGWFQMGRARTVAGLLEQHGKSARILDVGCGNGGFLANMHSLGFRNLEGTEFSPDSAKRVPQGLGIRVHVGDLTQLPLPDRTYDAITICHVLEHVRDPQATLSTCYRILKPGGRLYIAVPNQDSTQAIRYGRHWFHLDPPRHLFGFGPVSLSQLLRTTGFNRDNLSTFSLEQDPYGWIQSALNKAGFPRDRAYSTLKRTGKHTNAQRLTDLALVALLTPMGLAASALSSLFNRGGTLMVTATKD